MGKSNVAPAPAEDPEDKLELEPIETADDFFASSSKDRERDINDFISSLKAPKEKMEDVDTSFMDDPEEETPGESLTDEEREIASYLDVSDGHKEMARAGLLMVDKLLSTVAGMVTGENPDRYKRGKKPDDYEVEVTAAMMKKYEVRMSLEWMFIVAIVGAYSPAFKKAYDDHRKKRRALAKERREEELRVMAQNIRYN
ncbi:MAG: hypothetical protein R2824_15780 [Saprospiraceae bacterium]|nr:hypothetical protein [Lewinella sp.]